MKNNYNPFTVPENFFEDTRKQAISKYHSRRRTVRYGVLTILAVAFMLAVPGIIRSFDNTPKDMTANTLANMYEYDIFLQVNF